MATHAPALAPPADTASPSFLDSVRGKLAAVVGHRAFPVVALVGIYCVSVAVYTALNRGLVPNLFPDEMFYGRLSQNFAWGDGLTWRGSGWGLPPLWPLVMSLAWHGDSVPDSYSAAKVLGAALASATVVPVWLLGRTLVGPRLALIPAALCVLGPWMEVTQFLASENLAYPLATASLAGTVMAVRDTRTRWMVVSVVFGLLAAASRTQMLVLPVILVLALIIDVVRQPRGERRARIDARPRALWIGLIVAVVAVLLAFILKPGLTNYDVLSHHTSVGQVLKTAGRQAISTVLLFAVIPFAVVFALMARRENWRDDRIGPVLVTLVAAAVVILPVVARFDAWATVGIPVERYTLYLAPLLLIALVLAPGHISRRAAVISGLAVVALLLTLPKTKNYLEQFAVYGSQRRLDGLGSFFKDHYALGVALIALPITVGAMYAFTSRRRPRLGFAVGLGLVAGVMLALGWSSQSFEINNVKDGRAAVLPTHLDWIDRAADGPVALLSVAKAQPWRPNIDLYAEFFNRKVKYLYSTLPVGNGACNVNIKAGGDLKEGKDYCRGFPHNWVILEGPVVMSFWNQKVLARTKFNGYLVRIPDGPPRVFGVVAPPCHGNNCVGQLQLALYLDKPAKVAVTFGPSEIDHRVQTSDAQVATLPAHRSNTLNFKLPAGDQSVNLPVDWTIAKGAPKLKSVVVETGGKTYTAY